MEEEEEICRVCRSEGTPEHPLFHPCKCSGSIKHVHQECLLRWLEHSNKKHCELCKHDFVFTPVYSPEMPDVIPKTVLIKRAVDKLAKGIRFILRGFLVATIWLVLVPYFTVWVWRMYFWIGEKFAYNINGLEAPLWNTTYPTTTSPANITTTNTTLENPTAQPKILLKGNFALSGDHWARLFFVDCFEGQIISSIAVVAFFVIFLLREWVTQNQGADGARFEPAAGIAAPGAEADAPEGAAFEFVEHAVERLIAAQHHMEAVVEGEDDMDDSDSSSDSDSDEDEPQFEDQQHPAQVDGGVPEAEVPQREFDFTAEAQLELQRVQLEAALAERARLLEERRRLEQENQEVMARLRDARARNQVARADRQAAVERNQVARAQQQELVRRINERGIQRRAAARQAPEFEPVERDDEEDLDGILEAIGMQGPFMILLQNSLLFAAWMCAGLGVGICLPFMIGKTVLLMSPLRVVHLPLQFLDRITDPIVDFTLDRLAPVVKPTLSKTANLLPLAGLESSMEYLDGLVQQHIMPTWHAMFETAVSSDLMEGMVKEGLEALTDTVVPETVAGSTANGTTAFQLAQKWGELAYGNSSSEKMVAILAGYGIMFAIASWYLSRSQHEYGNTFRKIARDGLRETLLVLKIAFFIAIEMLVFPIFCGVVIGLCLIPAFQQSTTFDRVTFEMFSPRWFLIINWIVGTAFMFAFSTFVIVSRTLVRPGVMWFFRDPNDQDFHPVREILERPFWVLIRKLGTGTLMYLGLIVFGVALPVQLFRLVKGVFPLRISEYPEEQRTVEMIMRLFISLSIRWFNPTTLVRKALRKWWQKLSQWMRLSSFMYARNGERYPEEEGYIMYRTWTAWLMRSRPPIPGVDAGEENTVGSGEELDIDAPVIFVRDGGLFRVPNSDRIRHLKNRRVLVPVDEFGRALDPADDLPGEIDPLAELPSNTPTLPVDPLENTILVYGPPHFKLRLKAFVVFLWVSLTSFTALSIFLPMVVGRMVVALFTERKYHDTNSFAIGFYFLYALWYLVDWISVKAHVITTQGLQPIDMKSQMEALYHGVGTVLSLVFFFVGFILFIPFQLGLMFELYLILPLQFLLMGEYTRNDIFTTWIVGTFFIPIIQGYLMAMPHLQLAQDVRLVFAGNNPLDWNAPLALRRLLLPIFSKTGLATMGPVIAASTISNLFGIPPDKTLILAYPVTTSMFFTFYVIKESITLIRGWSAYVRDQEYLVGRQLHNMQEEAAAPVVQEQEPQFDQGAEGNDPHPTQYGIRRSSSELELDAVASSSAGVGLEQLELEDRIESYPSERFSSPAKNDHPAQYGIHTADSDSESELSTPRARRTLLVDNEDDWENGSIASRTRSRRRNQRL
ncbi:hypothetical protein BGZ59_002964 [Podila verticillata]|nr:hypothetical protein BGZ59_002964 [Podila verticillata]